MSGGVQRVWLILAKVTVVGVNPADLTTGSEALVQCFVPQTVLETALIDCDQVLQREGMRRTDVLKCVSFEDIDPGDDVPDFVKRHVLHARSAGMALTGATFISEDSASFRPKAQH
jgi:hypothetical protein